MSEILHEAQEGSIHPDCFEQVARLRANILSVFFGRRETVDHLLVALLSRGHALIEDVPGVGKTMLARAMARSIDCSFARVQLTPDMLPSDIVGVSVYNERTREFEFKPGPIFTHIFLADEINRTTPRTQSALLEAMNEAQVSVDGVTYRLEPPFMVIATQNPFEFEGTYQLPENQLDRFTITVHVGYPSRETERQMLRERPDLRQVEDLPPVMHREDVLALQQAVRGVRVSEAIMEYVLEIVRATREHAQLEIGISPRGTLTLAEAARALAMLSGRDFVVPDDVRSLVVPVCAHRIVPRGGVSDGRFRLVASILEEILDRVEVPL